MTLRRRVTRQRTGAPIRAVEVRQELFDVFIDVRTALKGRLPRRVFLAKASELYGDITTPSKKRCRDQEMELMIEKLRKDKGRIPTLSRDANVFQSME